MVERDDSVEGFVDKILAVVVLLVAVGFGVVRLDVLLENNRYCCSDHPSGALLLYCLFAVLSALLFRSTYLVKDVGGYLIVC